MTVLVETSYLRGYAAQIEGNHGGALATMERYCAEHCTRTDGLNGLLLGTRNAVGIQAWSYAGIFEGARRELLRTAVDLRFAADSYDRSDAASAERIWVSGRAGQQAGAYREQDVRTVGAGFSAGASVNLAVPRQRNETEDVRQSIDDLLQGVNGLIQRFTGFDLLGTAMPLVLGDWGTIRSIADAYGELEGGFKEVSQDLADGMNVLSGHWDSGPGGAAAAFDYHIRKRWVPALDAAARMANASEQNFQLLAQMYEYALTALLAVVNFYGLRIKRALQALRTVTSFRKYLFELYELVTDLYTLITDLTDVVIEQTLMFKEGVEQIVAIGRQIVDFIQDDFEVFRSA
ncbi:hypothetical protein [Plantactinospora sp. B24E8]|uniref:hypothetical protein n=1 Tax=Plantactinospora sp. B24E8 TaxID=3153567 RepID=UPI00325C6E3D